MPQKRPYFQWFDGTLDIPIQAQVDDPAGLQFLPTAASNKRNIAGSDSNVYMVADHAVNPRGAKSVIWSSEAYTYNGVAVPALTVNQKKATGSSATNLGAATPPTGMTLSTTLDLSPYRNIVLAVNLSALTGTSIQFELDMLDDSGTPVSLPIWKPAALTATGSLYVTAGPGVAFPQAAAAPSTAPTNYGAIAVPSGWTYYFLPMGLFPNGQFAWAVSSVTAASWTAWLYGTY